MSAEAIAIAGVGVALLAAQVRAGQAVHRRIPRWAPPVWPVPIWTIWRGWLRLRSIATTALVMVFALITAAVMAHPGKDGERRMPLLPNQLREMEREGRRPALSWRIEQQVASRYRGTDPQGVSCRNGRTVAGPRCGSGVPVHTV